MYTYNYINRLNKSKTEENLFEYRGTFLYIDLLTITNLPSLYHRKNYKGYINPKKELREIDHI
jgi:hypothetical protein